MITYSLLRHFTNKYWGLKPLKGFTILELIVVVIIISILATVALPNYSRTIERAHCNNALMQLRSIHAANAIYFAQEQFYWPLGGFINQNKDAINTGLGLHIIEDGVTYLCRDTNGFDTSPDQFVCTASRTGGGFTTLTLTEASLSNANPDTDNNPATESCP